MRDTRRPLAALLAAGLALSLASALAACSGAPEERPAPAATAPSRRPPPRSRPGHPRRRRTRLPRRPGRPRRRRSRLPRRPRTPSPTTVATAAPTVRETRVTPRRDARLRQTAFRYDTYDTHRRGRRARQLRLPRGPRRHDERRHDLRGAARRHDDGAADPQVRRPRRLAGGALRRRRGRRPLRVARGRRLLRALPGDRGQARPERRRASQAARRRVDDATPSRAAAGRVAADAVATVRLVKASCRSMTYLGGTSRTRRSQPPVVHGIYPARPEGWTGELDQRVGIPHDPRAIPSESPHDLRPPRQGMLPYWREPRCPGWTFRPGARSGELTIRPTATVPCGHRAQGADGVEICGTLRYRDAPPTARESLLG